MKKNQISIFIIIGIILVLSLALFFTVRITSQEKKIQTEIETSQLDISSLETYTENCLKESAKLNLLAIGLRSGFTYLPENNFKMPSFDTAYLYYQGDFTELKKKSLKEVSMN